VTCFLVVLNVALVGPINGCVLFPLHFSLGSVDCVLLSLVSSLALAASPRAGNGLVKRAGLFPIDLCVAFFVRLQLIIGLYPSSSAPLDQLNRALSTPVK